MKFERDIVCIDCETTGLNKSTDYIIQVGISKFNISDNGDIEFKESKGWNIQPSGRYVMSIGAYLKHGIAPKDLEGLPFFDKVADEILSFCENCDILTYNGFGVDIPFLEVEMNRCGKTFGFDKRKCYDAYKEEVRRNSNTLTETYKRYTNKELKDAHSAYADAIATVEVFKRQQDIKPYNEEEFISVDGFIEKKEVKGNICYCFNYGKYNGVPISYVKKNDLGYIDWIMNNESFSQATKDFIKKI